MQEVSGSIPLSSTKPHRINSVDQETSTARASSHLISGSYRDHTTRPKTGSSVRMCFLGTVTLKARVLSVQSDVPANEAANSISTLRATELRCTMRNGGPMHQSLSSVPQSKAAAIPSKNCEPCAAGFGLLNATLVAALTWLLAACSPQLPAVYEPSYSNSPPVTPTGVEYRFAVHPLHNSKRLFEVYQPLVELINEKAAPAFHLKLETSRDYASFEAKIASQKFAFAIPNPYQTLECEARGYSIIGKMGNDQQFRGIIVVRRDRDPQSVADLKGAAISFPAPTALAATMMPKMYLFEHGLQVDDIDARYVGSQESAIMNVLFGKTLAAGTWPPPWEALLRRRPELKNELMVKWETTPLVNNGLVVRNDIPVQHAKIVEEVVFHLHDNVRGRAILDAMEIGRFDTANTATFEPVREFVRRYEIAFGRRP